MTTKPSAFVTAKAFPLDKSDIHYNPSSEEVSIRREKFDAFVKSVQELQEKLEAAEDARDVAQYRARKEGKTADVLQALTEDVAESTAAIRAWLNTPGHTLQQLSDRTGIPYATCHRIINERLGTPNVEIGHLQKFVAAVAKGHVAGALHPRFPRVLLGLPKEIPEHDLVSYWIMHGSQVSTVHAGGEIAEKARELHPDLIVLDVSMPNLEKSGLERLKDLAKSTKNTMILLTGAIAEANVAFAQGSFENKKTKEASTEEGKQLEVRRVQRKF